VSLTIGHKFLGAGVGFGFFVTSTTSWPQCRTWSELRFSGLTMG